MNTLKKYQKYILRLTILAVLLTAVFMVGCTATKKPVPNQVTPPVPAPTTPTPVNPRAITPQVVPTPGNQARAKDAADDIAKKVSAINGVNKAYVVVVGNVALIGADIKQNIEGAKVEKIREQAATRAKEDPRIVSAVVETGPDAVTRIQKIASGIAQGRPISEFFQQINEFFNRVKPTT